MTKTLLRSFVALTLGSTALLAADSANQQLKFQVRPFVDIQVADESLDLVISNIPLGGEGSANAKSSYSLVNNKRNQKITASLDSDMPADTQLKLKAAAPKGAEGSSELTLSKNAVELARKVDQVNETGLELAYLFTASEKADTQPFVRTVTYTVVEM